MFSIAGRLGFASAVWVCDAADESMLGRFLPHGQTAPPSPRGDGIFPCQRGGARTEPTNVRCAAEGHHEAGEEGQHLSPLSPRPVTRMDSQQLRLFLCRRLHLPNLLSTHSCRAKKGKVRGKNRAMERDEVKEVVQARAAAGSSPMLVDALMNGKGKGKGKKGKGESKGESKDTKNKDDQGKSKGWKNRADDSGDKSQDSKDNAQRKCFYCDRAKHVKSDCQQRGRPFVDNSKKVSALQATDERPPVSSVTLAPRLRWIPLFNHDGQFLE